MTLTKVRSGGIKDDSVTLAKVAADSVAESKLDISNSPTDGYFLKYKDSTDKLTWAQINSDVAGDTSPQLGGELDSNNFDIKLSDGEKLLLYDHGQLKTKTGATNAVVSGLTGYVLQNSTVLDSSSYDLWFQSNGKKITFGTSDSTTHEVMRVQCSALGASQHGFVNLNYVTANAGGSTSSATKLSTTATGISVSGNVVLSNALLPSADSSSDLGTTSVRWRDIYADDVTDSKGNLRSIAANTQGGAYVGVAADAGKAIYISTGGVTINNSVFSAGDAVTIINNSGSDQTITQGSGVTIYNTADAATGNRTLAGRGMATIWFADAATGYISGAGLS